MHVFTPKCDGKSCPRRSNVYTPVQKVVTQFLKSRPHDEIVMCILLLLLLLFIIIY